MRIVWELADATLRRVPRSGSGPVARARTAYGGWLVASTSRVDPDEAAVVLRPGDVGTVAPAFARWAGFSRRETAVLLLLADGRTSRGVARELGISPYTVDDHLASLYRKAGVRGRDELLALVR
nr:helix-turn-helix transcriptional regulator [Nocardioides sp. MAH-18]